MKKTRAVLIASIVLLGISTFVLSFPALSRLIIIADNGISEGIGSYAPAISSVSICEWLTLGQDEAGRSNKDPNLFINKYGWNNAVFLHERKNTFSVQNETAIMVLSYPHDVFNNAWTDICSREGFSNRISFDYGQYHFSLNETELLCSGKDKSLTDFCISTPSPYVKWINLVGYSTIDFELVFLGFYYELFDNYFGAGTGGYPFQGWDVFIEEFFPLLKNRLKSSLSLGK